MRVLKRDLPLSILVDLLLQILFAITLLWLSSIYVIENIKGRPGKVSVEELNAKIKEMEKELVLLKEENRKLLNNYKNLTIEKNNLNEYVNSLKAKLGEDKIQKLLRAGSPDCFNGGKNNSPIILIQWKSESDVIISRGSDFESALKISKSISTLIGSHSSSEIVSVLSILVPYQNENNCKIRLRFIAPSDVAPAQWNSLRSQLISIFRTDTSFN